LTDLISTSATLVPLLEFEHGCQLNTAGATASNKGVPDAYVARGGDGQRASANFPGSTSVKSKASRTCICDEGGQKGICKVGMVKDVKEIDPEFHAQSLG
jgi:hypothetical protein